MFEILKRFSKKLWMLLGGFLLVILLVNLLAFNVAFNTLQKQVNTAIGAIGGLSLPSGRKYLITTEKFIGSTKEKLDAAIAACPKDTSCYVFVSPNLEKGVLPTSVPDNVVLLDTRGEGLRVVRRNHQLGSGETQYFPDGPLQTTLMGADNVPPTSTDHQVEGVLGIVSNRSTRTNAVGVWGTASSDAPGARVWGGFFSARTPNDIGADAQVIGLEVDTLNWAKDGVSPNASKVGVQIVGIGNFLTTNAVEILATEKARWVNGIVFQESSVAEKGTLIGAAGAGPYRLGLDLSHSNFTDAAIRIGLGQKIRLDSSAGPALFYTTKVKDGQDALIIQIPDGGLIFHNSKGETIFTIPASKQ